MNITVKDLEEYLAKYEFTAETVHVKWFLGDFIEWLKEK